MNRQEHLLTILIEECQELAKEAAKALRFGPLDRKTMNPGVINTDPNEPTNADKMEKEYNDLLAVVDMLREENPDIFRLNERAPLMFEKKSKVERYLDYSKLVGTLE